MTVDIEEFLLLLKRWSMSDEVIHLFATSQAEGAGFLVAMTGKVGLAEDGSSFSFFSADDCVLACVLSNSGLSFSTARGMLPEDVALLAEVPDDLDEVGVIRISDGSNIVIFTLQP